MATSKDRVVLGQLRTLFNVGAIRELSDGQLMERFATDRGEAAELAFAALLERHGPMVLRVCRGVLADSHDAQDAFQATFLVLVRKARTLWVHDSLGPWLHQVACRTAMCARKAAARRRRHEQSAASLARDCQMEPPGELEWAIHEEIDRLPEAIRAPVVLCDLGGRTHEQAARHLGLAVGTVKSRLSRGRERLRDRLRRRGFGPDAGVLAAIARPSPEAAIPASLLQSTTAAAVRLAATRTFLQGSAATLAQGVLKSMFITRCLKAASFLLVVGALAFAVDSAGQGPAPGATDRSRGDRQERPDGDAVQAKPSGPGNITVDERGVVESANSQDVFCQVEGGTSIVGIIPEGSRVKKWDLVCELDSASLRDQQTNQTITVEKCRAAHQDARLAREAAELARAEFEIATYPHELDVVRGEIALGESAVRRAEARLERSRQARQRAASAKASQDKAAAATTAEIVAELDLENRIDEAEGTLAREKLALAAAQRKLTNLEKFHRPRLNLLAVELERALTEERSRDEALNLETKKLSKLKMQVANCKLFAPDDGVVVYAHDASRSARDALSQIEEGANIRERQKIFSVIKPDGPLRVTVYVPEAIVAGLRPGASVRVKIDAYPNRPLTGTVQDVAPLPTTFRQWVDKVYRTRISLGERIEGLRPGMTAEVAIVVAQPAIDRKQVEAKPAAPAPTKYERSTDVPRRD